MNIFWIATLTLASLASAKAQDVPPLAPLRGDAASLPDTMKFIEDKVTGKVNYIVYWHDNITGTDSPPAKLTFEISNVSADAGRCQIRYHVRFDDGKKITENDFGVPLKMVREITFIQMDVLAQRNLAKAGHPERSAKIDPAISVVMAKLDTAHQMVFAFYDDTLADRVSKALQHAADLCGGGNKDPF